MTNEGLELWAKNVQAQLSNIETSNSQIHERINKIERSNFTKEDMKQFQQTVCIPNKVILDDLAKFKSKTVGIAIAVGVVASYLMKVLM